MPEVELTAATIGKQPMEQWPSLKEVTPRTNGYLAVGSNTKVETSVELLEPPQKELWETSPEKGIA